MRKLLLTILFLAAAPFGVHAYTSPGSPQGFVNDFAKVLDQNSVSQIETKLTQLEKDTGAEVAVVIVPTIGTDETIETYAEKLFQEWGIGKDKQDNGLLLLVAINDRQMKIETGYGLEGAVTDIQAGNIINKVIVPEFRSGNYGLGIAKAVDALDDVIRKSPEAAQYSESSPSIPIDNFAPFIFVGIFILNALAHVLGKSKSWWMGGVIGAFLGGIALFVWGMAVGLTAIVILTILGLIFDFIVSKFGGGRGPGSWFGPGTGGFGGGSFGGGGGFGGFGGGSSGGGGASGRW